MFDILYQSHPSCQNSVSWTSRTPDNTCWGLPAIRTKMGLPGLKCLSGVRTNGPKWHVRLAQMSGQSAISPFSQIYGLSPWYYWWQNPEVVRPADFRRIVIEYRTSPLSSLPMQYWKRGVCRVEPILNYGGCPVSSWWPNTQLWRVSCQLMVSQYSTTKDILWAYGEPILNYGGCPVSSWWANAQLRRISCELMVTQYSTMEGVLWAHGRPILIYGGSPVSSWWANTQLRRVSNGLRSPTASRCLYFVLHTLKDPILDHPRNIFEVNSLRIRLISTFVKGCGQEVYTHRGSSLSSTQDHTVSRGWRKIIICSLQIFGIVVVFAHSEFLKFVRKPSIEISWCISRQVLRVEEYYCVLHEHGRVKHIRDKKIKVLEIIDGVDDVIWCITDVGSV